MDETTSHSGFDDWEAHWDEFADSASENPAQRYRQALISDLVWGFDEHPRVLDIGSGQGDLLSALRQSRPDAALAGLELSATGVALTRAKVPDALLHQIDLLTDSQLPAELIGWADVAVCSEVLEHVENAPTLLRHAGRAVAPGGRIIITVPGGPRTAFDRHIGHRRHYSPHSLRRVIREADLIPEMVRGHGFPFFNAYKLVVLLRGHRLIEDATASAPPSRLASLAMTGFGLLLRPGRCSRRIGWQVVGTARVPLAETSPREESRQ